MLKKNDSKFIGLFISIGLIFTGCTSIQLVSNYDESTDTQAQELQKKLDTYLISMQNLQGKPTTYEANQKFYEGVLADINALQNRASIIYKNKQTEGMVLLLKDQFVQLIELHKGCVRDPQIKVDQYEIIQNQGVDLSMDCKKEFGYIEQLDRGENTLPRRLSTVQSGFNSVLNSITRLELAKKRSNKDTQSDKAKE